MCTILTSCIMGVVVMFSDVCRDHGRVTPECCVCVEDGGLSSGWSCGRKRD